MRDGVEDARQAYHYTTRRTVPSIPLPNARRAAPSPPVHDQLYDAPATICRTAQSVHK